MNSRFISSVLVSLVCVLSPLAKADKLLIITDQASGQTAIKLQKLIRSTAPFKFLKPGEFSVDVQIIDEKAHPMNCHSVVIKYTEEQITYYTYIAKQAHHPLSAETIDRYRNGFTIFREVVCDVDAVKAIGQARKADREIFVHLSLYEAGSGGIPGPNGPTGIPTILSGSRLGVGLHEFIHIFGLGDEYALQPEETAFFCGLKWVNIAMFNETKTYSSSDEVRAELADEIPWLANLPKTAVLINNGHLGSPPTETVGLFPAKTCSAATPSVQSWKASRETTIMEDVRSTYIPKPYWPVILSKLKVSKARIDELMAKAPSVPTWVPDPNQMGGGSPRGPIN